MAEQKLLLEETLFQSAYTLFGVQTDEELVYKMSMCCILYTAVIGIYGLIKPAPYGKFSRSWTGPTVNAKFAWTIQEIPAWVTPLILLYQSPAIYKSNTPNLLLAILFTVHYVQRSLVYPLRIRERAKPVPISAVIVGLLICQLHGLLLGHHLLNVEKIENSVFFVPGVVLFTLGMAINIHHDGILLGLKKSTNSDDGRSEYKIPRGSLFEFVSGANYLGEIIEWWGFAVASGKIPQFVFAIFSSVFLGMRSWHQHQYYKKHFGSTYPSKRTAVIPFII